ncbi:MAG: hypothetical protein IPO14_04040 [Saprospiraceae bacterium]|nr:hypothetical protein [Saprospiraceae bacterium]
MKMRKRLYRDFWMNGKQGKPSFWTICPFHQIPNWLDVLAIFYVEFYRPTEWRTGIFPWDPANVPWISGITFGQYAIV